jgi:hypothetical protein
VGFHIKHEQNGFLLIHMNQKQAGSVERSNALVTYAGIEECTDGTTSW